MRSELLVVAAAVVLTLAAVPLMLGKVPRNSVYGVRTKSAMSGTEAQWYSVNKAGGTALFIGGLASLLTFAVLSRVEMQDTARPSIYVAVLLLFVLGTLAFTLTRQGGG